MISTPAMKFFSTAYSSRLVECDCVVLSLLLPVVMVLLVLLLLLGPVPGGRRTLPIAAPTFRAFCSLWTLRVSTARNAAVTDLADLPFDSRLAFPALL